MAGEAVIRSEGDKRLLVINYKGSPYGADLAQYPQVMKDVIDRLQTVDVEEVVLSEYYERIYNQEQTRWLKQVADLIARLEADAVWSPSHLGTTTDSKSLAPRHDTILTILNNLHVDPFKAYLSLLNEMKTQQSKANTLAGPAVDDLNAYLKTLRFMLGEMEKLELVKKLKVYVTQLGKIPADRGIYHSLFEVAIKPSFIGSRIFFTGTENLELVDQYEVLGTKIYVYKHPDKVELLYFINPPEYTLPPEKYFLLEKTKEVVAGHRPGDALGFTGISQARQYFHKIYVATIADLAQKNNIALTVQEKEELADIVTRYTVGYGVMEILLSDKQVTDVYVDSPLGVKPIYLVHSKYGQCQTNVVFSAEEAQSLVSRFRALSGRPFDEAHPILDFDLEDLQTRIAVIGRPLSLDGTAFAFRLHKPTPWTLPQFLDQKMFNPFAAGLFSYFVDAQASMLIVGSRGSGKCLSGDALVQLEDGSMRAINELVEPRIQSAPAVIDVGDGVCADCSDLRILTLTPELKIRPVPVSKVWRRTAPAHLCKLKLASGKEIECTPEHPFFVVRQGLVLPLRADSIEAGELVATPRYLPVASAKAIAPNIPVLVKERSYLGCLQLVRADLEKIAEKEELKSAAAKMELRYKTILNLKNGVRNAVSGEELDKIGSYVGKPASEYLSAATGFRSYHSPQHMHMDADLRPIDEKYARFLGLLYGDGHVDEVEIAFTNNDGKLRLEFATLAAELFGVRSSDRKPKARSPMAQISSRGLSRLIRSRFGLPAGKKASVQQIPDEILKSSNNVLSRFIQAYFDCDSSVNVKKGEIEFCTASGKLAEQMQYALHRFGIVSIRRPKMVKGKVYWRLSIYGENCLLYWQQIDFGLERKRDKLDEALRSRRFNSNIDVVPNAWALLKYTKDTYGFGKLSLDQLQLGRGKLQRLSDEFSAKQPEDEKIRQMKTLAYSDVFWDKIVSIEKVPSREPFVYDLTVDSTHSFVANGIVAHNTSMLQAMMQEIPQNLRIIVQEDSVAGGSQIWVERSGSLQKTTVGELIDSLIREYGAIEENGKEILAFNPDNVKIFSLDVDGSVKLSRVSQFFRHKTTKQLYRVRTSSGKALVVTGDHSLFKYNPVKRSLSLVKTNELRKGDVIAGANVTADAAAAGEQQLLKKLALFAAEIVVSVEELPPTNEFVYDFSIPLLENFVCGGVVAHNTQELPVPALKRLGFNIQRLKTRPPLGKQSEAEVSAEDALRTALRLGDSVLIVGEVRSQEAKALFEAMRVGAVGNVVMGTIHGESAYSIWDRIVNDLGVPTTSFKATDFAIVSAPIRFGGSLKRARRVIEVTEVKKHWNEDPGRENGFLDWMRFDAGKDDLELFQKNLEESEWIQRVRKVRGITFEQVLSEINARAAAKQFLVDLKRKNDVPKLLEAEYTVRGHNKYMLLAERQREEFGSVDHDQLLKDYRAWVQSTLLREALAQKQAGA